MNGTEVVELAGNHHRSAVTSPAKTGVVIEAASLEDLFAAATRELCNCITEAGDVLPHESRVVELAAPDRDRLLLAWLRELLAVFAAEGLLFSLARVTITSRGADGVGLEAQAWGEPFDPSRHVLRRSVDRVDPHDLHVVLHEGRWRTRLCCSGPSAA